MGKPTITAPSKPALRNRLEVRRILQQAHLSCPHFASCATISELKEFAKAHSFPLVIKAPRTAGHTYTCQNVDELIERFQALRSSLNFLEVPLIEEWINGKKYIVDLFSDGKEIRLTHAWIDDKSRILIRPQNVPGVIEYAFEAARALAIEKGGAQIEIKDDPKRGPTLLEITA